MRKNVSLNEKFSTYLRLCPPKVDRETKALGGGAIHHSCVGMFRLVFHRPPQISLLLSEITYPFFRGEESHQSLGSELFYRCGKRNLATSRGVLEDLEFFLNDHGLTRCRGFNI